MTNWEILIAIFAGVTTVTVATRAIYLKGIRPLWRWLKKWDAMFKEFVPDHGNSMKDQITNLEVITGSIKSIQEAQIMLDDLPMITCNGGGRCIAVNKSWCDLSGMQENEAFGWGWLDAIDGEDKERVRLEFVASLAANSQFNSVHKMFNKRTQEVFNVKAICVINRNSKQQVISIVGTVIRLQDDVAIKADKPHNGGK